MLFTTPTQWVALAVALVAGWLLGLASHPGGKKWRTRYLAERDTHAELRKTQTARIGELERENARIAELERENARLVEREREQARLASERPAVERAVLDDRPVAERIVERPASDRAAPAWPDERRPL